MHEGDLLLSLIDDKEVRRRIRGSSERIRRTFAELFGGYRLRAEDVLNEVVRVKNYDGLVTVTDINFYSVCEHHFAPFFGRATVCYEPNHVITGVGKIVRLVRDVHARRLQIQELLTADVALDMMRVVKPKGVLVTTRARHLCVCSRGPGDDTAETIVRYGLGSLKSNVKADRTAL
jgi:GTP cyclohydrolase I